MNTLNPKQALRAVKQVSRNGRRPSVAEIMQASLVATEFDRLAYYQRVRGDYTFAPLFFRCTRNN